MEDTCYFYFTHANYLKSWIQKLSLKHFNFKIKLHFSELLSHTAFVECWSRSQLPTDRISIQGKRSLSLMQVS